MTIYTATIPIRDGWTLTVDGETHHVRERCDLPKGNDTFVVEHDGEEIERHIDWFHDIASDADEIVLERDASIEEQPQSTHGRDPVVGVGNFTCTCGCDVIDSDRGDDAVELTPIPDERMLPGDEQIKCPECYREWRLVDDGERWAEVSADV